MDRLITYAGTTPLESDVLAPQRYAMQALGMLMRAVLGDGPVLDGFGCTPGTGPTLNVGPGMIAELNVVDAYPFGVLPADATPLVKAGFLSGTTSLSTPAPPVAGQQVSHLVQVQMIEADGAPLVLPYYDAGNPVVPFSGAYNNGIPNNTQRTVRAQVTVKLGTPDTAGAQQPPLPDQYCAPAWVVTLSQGDTAVTPAGIALHPEAPFVFCKLPETWPVQEQRTFTSSGKLIIPPGKYRIRLRLVGAGGPGGHGNTGGGGGGAAGGVWIDWVIVNPGDLLDIIVGTGGVAGTILNGSTVGASAGGDTYVLLNGVEIGRATGGGGGGLGPNGPGSTAFGVGVGGTPGHVEQPLGESGYNGLSAGGINFGGAGGGTDRFRGGGERKLPTGSDAPGNLPQIGSGGGGGVGNGLGVNGGGGLAVIEV